MIITYFPILVEEMGQRLQLFVLEDTLQCKCSTCPGNLWFHWNHKLYNWLWWHLSWSRPIPTNDDTWIMTEHWYKLYLQSRDFRKKCTEHTSEWIRQASLGVLQNRELHLLCTCRSWDHNWLGHPTRNQNTWLDLMRTKLSKNMNFGAEYLHIGGRLRDLAISTMFTITVLIPLPLPSTLASSLGIL